MRRLLFSLIVIMISGNIFAQTPDASRIDKIFSSKEAFWETKVDTTTNWGKWLMSTKPYWDKIMEAEKKDAKAMINISPTSSTSPDDYFKRSSAVMEDNLKAMQDITPPEELKALHALMVEECALTATMPTMGSDKQHQVMKEVDKLSDEVNKEQNKVFKQHGVPQNIIDGFLKGSGV